MRVAGSKGSSIESSLPYEHGFLHVSSKSEESRVKRKVFYGGFLTSMPDWPQAQSGSWGQATREAY